MQKKTYCKKRCKPIGVVGVHLYLRSHAFVHMKNKHSFKRKERIFYRQREVDDRLRSLSSCCESLERFVRTDVLSCTGIEEAPY